MASIKRCLASPRRILFPASRTVIAPSIRISTSWPGEPGAPPPAAGVMAVLLCGRVAGSPAAVGTGHWPHLLDTTQKTTQVDPDDHPGGCPATNLSLVLPGRRNAAPRIGGQP